MEHENSLSFSSGLVIRVLGFRSSIFGKRDFENIFFSLTQSPYGKAILSNVGPDVFS